MPINFGTKLDRIYLHVDVPSNLVKGVEKGFYQTCGAALTTYDQTYEGPSKFLRAGFLPEHGRDRIQLVLARMLGKNWLQYRFSPNAIDAKSFQNFVKHTNHLGYGCYSHALQIGRLTYHEIALDCYGSAVSDYLFHRRYVKDTKIISGINKGSSVYLGSRCSNTQYIAYDKAEERHAAGLPDGLPKVLRIEARRRSPAVSLQNLSLIKNPFIGLEIIDKQALRKSGVLESVESIDYFLKLATKNGVRAALKANFSISQRKNLVIGMRECRPFWWDPGTVMDGFAKRAQCQLHGGIT